MLFVFSLFIFLTLPFIYLFEYLIVFPIGLLVVFPLLLLYKRVKKFSYYELDKVFLKAEFPINFVLSFWTNSQEPMPLYGKAKSLWKNKPEWYRYLRWHIRNPISDFNKYYLGYFKYRDRAVLIKKYELFDENMKIEIKRITDASGFYRILIFPRFDIYAFHFWFCAGWKRRGCLSLSLKRRNRRPW